jgi:hypothetical protein
LGVYGAELFFFRVLAMEVNGRMLVDSYACSLSKNHVLVMFSVVATMSGVAHE